MRKRTIVILSVLIALMAAIIVAAVWYLYSAPESQTSVQVLSDTTPVATLSQPSSDKNVSKDESKAEADKDGSKDETKTEADKDVSKDETKIESKDEAKTETKVEVAEFKVKNSYSGKMNTLRQNADNSLELIDHNGKSLWKNNLLAGKIVGEPAQIDIYNNNKIQYLIAQGKSLHLVDRLGREVSNFPLTLPGEAKSGPQDKKGSNNVIYWKIETSAGVVYFDKKNKKVLNQLP